MPQSDVHKLFSSYYPKGHIHFVLSLLVENYGLHSSQRFISLSHFLQSETLH